MTFLWTVGGKERHGRFIYDNVRRRLYQLQCARPAECILSAEAGSQQNKPCGFEWNDHSHDRTFVRRSSSATTSTERPRHSWSSSRVRRLGPHGMTRRPAPETWVRAPRHDNMRHFRGWISLRLLSRFSHKTHEFLRSRNLILLLSSLCTVWFPP